MLKSFNDSIEENVGNDLLSEDLLLIANDSPAYIDSNINIDTKVKLNLDEDMTGNNLLKKNYGIKPVLTSLRPNCIQEIDKRCSNKLVVFSNI